MRSVVEEMLADALTQRFTKSRFHDLQDIVMTRLRVFNMDCSESSASILSLRLKLKLDTTLVHVKCFKYSNSHRQFLCKLVARLLDDGLIYPNRTSK